MADLRLMGLTADVVSSYLTRNGAHVDDLPGLIRGVYEALEGESTEAAAAAETKVNRTPAEVRRSIRKEALISFIDGRPYKTLRRHLAAHGHTPESYREAFGLPAGYPMVSADYSAQRSAYAKSIGLGVKGRGKAPSRKKR